MGLHMQTQSIIFYLPEQILYTLVNVGPTVIMTELNNTACGVYLRSVCSYCYRLFLLWLILLTKMVRP